MKAVFGAAVGLGAGMAGFSGAWADERAPVVVEASARQGLPHDRERIGLDTNVFIYFLEDHPRYGPWCARPCGDE